MPHRRKRTPYWYTFASSGRTRAMFYTDCGTSRGIARSAWQPVLVPSHRIGNDAIHDVHPPQGINAIDLRELTTRQHRGQTWVDLKARRIESC